MGSLQHYGEGAVIGELYGHMGAEDTVLHNLHLEPALRYEKFIELFGGLRGAGICEAGSVSVGAVRVKRELRYYQQRTVHLFQREVYFPIFIGKDPQAGQFFGYAPYVSFGVIFTHA